MDAESTLLRKLLRRRRRQKQIAPLYKLHLTKCLKGLTLQVTMISTRITYELLLERQARVLLNLELAAIKASKKPLDLFSDTKLSYRKKRLLQADAARSCLCLMSKLMWKANSED